MLRGGEVDRGQDHEEEETIVAVGDVVQVDHVIVMVARLCQLIFIVRVLEGVAQVDRDNNNNNNNKERVTCQGIEPHDLSKQLNTQLIKHRYR